MTVAVLLILGMADLATAGANYARGLALLEEKRFDEAVQAFEEALRNAPNEAPAIKYRDDTGRHKHAYYPYFQLALGRMGQAQAEGTPYVKRERLQMAVRNLSQTAHPDAAAKLEEARAALGEVEKQIAEIDASAPPPEAVQLKTSVEKLCDAENFEQALQEIEGAAAILGRYPSIKRNLLALVQGRQKSTLQRYDLILSSRLENISRTDPTLEAETILPLLRPALVPAEVKKDPPARFQWVQEFFSLYERELDAVRSCSTLPPDRLLKSASGFDEVAAKAMGIDLFTGFRAARNVAHSMRLARLKELAGSGDPGTREYRQTSESILKASEETRARTEERIGELLKGERPPEEMKRYVETDLPYQKRQQEAVRKRIEEAITAYEQRVAAEGLARRCEEALFSAQVMADPEECRKVGMELTGLEGQAHFESLPPAVRGRILFLRALCDAVATFLDTETPERVRERCKGDVLKAFALDPKVDVTWRESGKLSPRIVTVFDRIRQR